MRPRHRPLAVQNEIEIIPEEETCKQENLTQPFFFAYLIFQVTENFIDRPGNTQGMSAKNRCRAIATSDFNSKGFYNTEYPIWTVNVIELHPFAARSAINCGKWQSRSDLVILALFFNNGFPRVVRRLTTRNAILLCLDHRASIKHLR